LFPITINLSLPHFAFYLKEDDHVIQFQLNYFLNYAMHYTQEHILHQHLDKRQNR